MPYDIEYAKLTATPAFIRPENKSYLYIDQNAQLFIDLYNKCEDDYLQNVEANKKKYADIKRSFETKICNCGGKIRYVSSYDFWGCEYHKNPGIHNSFSKKEPDFFDGTFSLKDNWLTDIIKESGFKAKVKAKELFEFYESAGMEDLRTKYGFSSTYERIVGFIKTNRRSKEQESECYDYLKNKYPKVLQQQCITYKFLSSKKETFCIPDFICSDSNSVFIIDAKLDHANDEKMDLYVALISSIMKDKNDLRPVFGLHIIYESEIQYSLNNTSRYGLITIKK